MTKKDLFQGSFLFYIWVNIHFVFWSLFDIINIMKIIHCADLHIEVKEMKGLSVEKRKIKRNRMLQNFIDLANFAENNKVDAILLCGDTFDVPSPTKNTVSLFKKVILNHPNIKFFYVWGNHDEKFSPFGADEKPANFILFGENFKKFDVDDEVTIGGVSLPRFIMDSLYSTVNFDKDRFNILMLHGPVNTADQYFNGIYTNKLVGKNIDYLALGHIHLGGSGKIDERGIWRFSGCLEGKNFNDASKIGEKKGFYLLEIENKKMTSSFIPFSRYDYRVIKLNITSNIDHFQIVNKLNEILSNLSKDDIVKVVLKGKHKEENPIQVDMIKAEFENKFFHFEVVDESQTEFDFERYSKETYSLKGEFLRSVYADKTLQDAEKEKIATIGLEALKGEDLSI